jgi:hypothetical protein
VMSARRGRQRDLTSEVPLTPEVDVSDPLACPDSTSGRASAHITGGHGSSSAISKTPKWSPPTKIAAKYLAPYLGGRDRLAVAA